MEMLVTKFSKGKYANESELFSEPISEYNVKLMGEMIALQALIFFAVLCKIFSLDRADSIVYAPRAKGKFNLPSAFSQ